MKQVGKKTIGRPRRGRNPPDLDGFIGSTIFRLRQSTGLTQRELGACVMCNHTTLARVERGEQSASIAMLFDLLYALDAGEADFLAIVREDMRLRAVAPA